LYSSGYASFLFVFPIGVGKRCHGGGHPHDIGADEAEFKLDRKGIILTEFREVAKMQGVMTAKE
jgi:hypothetical protein